jgi:hypothetical protein
LNRDATASRQRGNWSGSGATSGGLVLKPPVSQEDLKTDTEYDPEGAEEFVALIRALRKESSRLVAL